MSSPPSDAAVAALSVFIAFVAVTVVYGAWLVRMNHREKMRQRTLRPERAGSLHRTMSPPYISQFRRVKRLLQQLRRQARTTRAAVEKNVPLAKEKEAAVCASYVMAMSTMEVIVHLMDAASRSARSRLDPANDPDNANYIQGSGGDGHGHGEHHHHHLRHQNAHHHPLSHEHGSKHGSKHGHKHGSKHSTGGSPYKRAGTQRFLRKTRRDAARRREEAASMIQGGPTVTSHEIDRVLGVIERCTFLLYESEEKVDDAKRTTLFSLISARLSAATKNAASVQIAAERMAKWHLDSPELEDMERRMFHHTSFSDTLVRTQKLVWDDLIKDDEDNDLSCCGRFCGAVENDNDLLPTWLDLPWLMDYPVFYGTFFVGYFAIWISFLIDIGSDDGFRRTKFLSIPPQYDLENVKIQRIMLPMVYAVMHSTLYSLGWLALPLLRGFHQFFSVRFPRLRLFIPFDDFIFFHKMCGVLCLFGLLAGAVLWLIMMASSCLSLTVASTEAAQTKACQAFSPVIVDATTDANDELYFDSFEGASYFDPRDNVLFLRETVWILWFGVIPLILWAREKPADLLPAVIKRNWWEICFYSHLFVGVSTIACALYARFEVFYPVTISWGLWIIELLREYCFRTSRTAIIINPSRKVRSTTIYGETENTPPRMLELVMETPQRGFSVGAGQWVYILCKDIDLVWHPFSLSSCTGDTHVELQIGIHGKWREDIDDEWLQPDESATWTYKLYRKFAEARKIALERNETQRIPILIKGPYGR